MPLDNRLRAREGNDLIMSQYSAVFDKVAGGLFSTVGVFFCAIDRNPYNQATWHVFVTAGSSGHSLSVPWHVVPVNL